MKKSVMISVLVLLGLLAGCINTIEQRCHRESNGDTICTTFQGQRWYNDPQIIGVDAPKQTTTPIKESKKIRRSKP